LPVAFSTGMGAEVQRPLAMVVIGGVIFWEAVQRLRTPEPVEGGPMIAAAPLGGPLERHHQPVVAGRGSRAEPP
jgi:hypothetical protein